MRARGRGAGLLVWLSLFVSGAALAAAFPAILRLPRRDPQGAPAVPHALFSHRGHAAFACYACHPATFPQAPLAFTHEEMRGGRFCGRCHDGGTAFAIEGAQCGSCHVAAR